MHPAHAVKRAIAKARTAELERTRNVDHSKGHALRLAARASSLVAVLVLLPVSSRADDGAKESPTAVAAAEPSTRGVVVQLRSAVALPYGGAVDLPMQSLQRVLHAEVVPIRLDFGYRLDRFYAGVFAQKSHGDTSAAQLTSSNGAASAPRVTDFELGATAEYHFFLDARLFDPWLGIYAARRSMWLTTGDAQGVRLKGPEAGVTAGVDWMLMTRLTMGAYVTLGHSLLAVSLDDDSHPLDSRAKVSWLGAGLRGSFRL